MKKVLWILLPLSLAIPTVAQQGAPALAAGLADSQPASYTITERGPHHREWSRVTWETNHQGQVVAVTNAAYTELATAMHYYDATSAQWMESQAAFEITPDGYAVARRGQHQVILAPNINATNAVGLLMPDGQSLTSRPLGLVFHDTASGTNVLIAELKDCGGQWLSPDVVTYPDAFDGLKAALRYTYTREGFEQDVVVYENPGSPATYGLDPATTQLETWTEFFAPPIPRLTAVLAKDGIEDQRVEFGTMALGQGQAYFMDLANRVEPSMPVRKTWQEIGGRTFLVEAVRYAAAKPLLDRLVSAPESTVRLYAQRVVNSRDQLVAQFTPHFIAAPKLVASITPGRMIDQSGLVLDYTTINSTQTNYVFKGDTTYYISGPVNLNGTTIFEGATAIKYAPTNSANLTLNGPSVWQGAMYRPSVFTARDDNTVGETISGSTGNPSTSYYGSAMVKLNYDASPLKYLRVSYASKAIQLGAWSQSHSLSHAQLLNCQYGFCNYADDDLALTLHNVLVYKVPGFGYGDWTHYYGEQVTIDQSTNVNDTIVLTNSLVVASSGFSGGTSNRFLSSGSGVFQTVGAASYYLADNSTNRNAGTTNLSPSLLAELKQRTTYPPYEITTNFTGDTVLSPRADRDTDIPDLGYHYDPLDYVVSGRTLTNATLTLTNGVALGTYGASASYGIWIRAGGKLVSEGSPANLNHLVRYNTVQEQATTNWSSSSVGPAVKITDGPGQARCRFTGWSLLGAAGNHLYTDITTITPALALTDCQFAGGGFSVERFSVALTNCLWERVALDLSDDGSSVDRYVFNNLFGGGSLYLQASGSGTWRIRDNLFDRPTLNQDGTFDHGYNGYVTNCDRLSPNQSTDKVLTNNPVYQTSWLGSYYYPTNDGNLSRLIDAGSVANAALVGLYHYTTTTNQVKEATTTNDIGFHYVAVNTNGLPFDTDLDGIPDYAADANGNGVEDEGETPWGYDGDGDGLPDSWELHYFGSLSQNASGDYDGDCLSNLQEYQLASNPAEQPTITTPPACQFLPAGSEASFSVTAAQSCLTYQWSRFTTSWSTIPGATNTSLSVPSVQMTNHGEWYGVNATSGAGTAWAARPLFVLDASAWAVWTNYIAHTNGKTATLWSAPISHPSGWPNTPPVMAWNTNCLLYGMTGFTAISQCNSFEGSSGQIPVTAITRRHGYMRGHGQGDNGLRTNRFGEKVWFCAGDNTVVERTVAADFIRYQEEPHYDYGLVIFTEDLPANITPIAVMARPTSLSVLFSPCQYGYMSANIPPFDCYQSFRPPFNDNTWQGGDSGSPDMIPTLDGHLVMVSGRDTSGPSAQMQADMDELSLYLSLNPTNYQLNWYNP